MSYRLKNKSRSVYGMSGGAISLTRREYVHVGSEPASLLATVKEIAPSKHARRNSDGFDS